MGKRSRDREDIMTMCDWKSVEIIEANAWVDHIHYVGFNSAQNECIQVLWVS